jgi:hypothetical protein
MTKKTASSDDLHKEISSVWAAGQKLHEMEATVGKKLSSVARLITPKNSRQKRAVLAPEMVEALEILQAENELHRRIYTAATLTQSAMEAALEDLGECMLCPHPGETEDSISQLAFEAKQKTSFMHRRLSAASQALTAKCAQARRLLSKREISWDLDQCQINIDKVIHEITSSAALKQQAEEAHQFIEDTRLLLTKCDDSNALRLLTTALRDEDALLRSIANLREDAGSDMHSPTTKDQTITSKGAPLPPQNQITNKTASGSESPRQEHQPAAPDITTELPSPLAQLPQNSAAASLKEGPAHLAPQLPPQRRPPKSQQRVEQKQSTPQLTRTLLGDLLAATTYFEPFATLNQMEDTNDFDEIGNALETTIAGEDPQFISEHNLRTYAEAQVGIEEAPVDDSVWDLIQYVRPFCVQRERAPRRTEFTSSDPLPALNAMEQAVAREERVHSRQRNLLLQSAEIANSNLECLILSADDARKEHDAMLESEAVRQLYASHDEDLSLGNRQSDARAIELINSAELAVRETEAANHKLYLVQFSLAEAHELLQIVNKKDPTKNKRHDTERRARRSVQAVQHATLLHEKILNEWHEARHGAAVAEQKAREAIGAMKRFMPFDHRHHDFYTEAAHDLRVMAEAEANKFGEMANQIQHAVHRIEMIEAEWQQFKKPQISF